MKWLIPLLLAVCGCFKEGMPLPEDNRSPKAKEFNVTLLFVHDGCRVYRFSDDSVHYYANCGCSTSMGEERCVADGNGGQNCYPVEVTTRKKER